MSTTNQVKRFITEAGVKCTAELIEGEKKQSLGDFIFDYEKRFDATSPHLLNTCIKKEDILLPFVIKTSLIPSLLGVKASGM